MATAATAASFRDSPKEPCMKKKTKRVNWKKAAIALARCAQFTIGFSKHLGKGTGALVNTKTGRSEGPWEEKFFDALDMVGVVYDRKAYYAGLGKSERRRRDLQA
jgi:hypothetical protein